MAAAKRQPTKKLPTFSFPVIVTEDADGVMTVTTGEIVGTLKDELNVREYVEETANGYLNFLDSLDIDGDVDDNYEDEDDEAEPAPVKKPAPRRK